MFRSLIRSGCAFCAVLLLGLAPAIAERSFEDYLDRLSEHPQIAEILEKSVMHSEAAGAEMGLPDPMLMLGLENLPVSGNSGFNRDMMTSKMIGFSQAVPNYRLRRAKSDKQTVLSAQQHLAADYVEHRLYAMLTSALAQRQRIKTQQNIARQQLGHYRELENYFKGQLESGRRVYWRFSQVDVERSAVEQRLNDLEAEQDAIEAELVRLVGEVPQVELPELSLHMWNGMPDRLYPVRLAEHNVAAAARDVEAAKAAYGPNYSFSAAYMQRDRVQGMRADDMFSLRAGVSIPFWSGSSQEPRKRAAEAGERSAAAARDDTVRRWVQQMTALQSRRKAAEANIKTLAQRRTALRGLIAATQRDYESGQSGLDTVLDARINLAAIAAQLAEQEARLLILTAEYNSHILKEERQEEETVR